MKKNLKNSYQDIDDFFSASPNANQKAWGLINHFYHLILTYMEDKGMTQADLAKILGKSRSAVSQMFNKNPNISIKRMVEIADAIGINIQIESPEVMSVQSVKKATLEIPVENNWFRPAHIFENKNIFKISVTEKPKSLLSYTENLKN